MPCCSRHAQGCLRNPCALRMQTPQVLRKLTRSQSSGPDHDELLRRVRLQTETQGTTTQTATRKGDLHLTLAVVVSVVHLCLPYLVCLSNVSFSGALIFLNFT